MGSSIPSPTLSSCSLSEFYHGIQGLPQVGILKELVKMFKMRKQKKKINRFGYVGLFLGSLLCFMSRNAVA